MSKDEQNKKLNNNINQNLDNIDKKENVKENYKLGIEYYKKVEENTD